MIDGSFGASIPAGFYDLSDAMIEALRALVLLDAGPLLRVTRATYDALRRRGMLDYTLGLDGAIRRVTLTTRGRKHIAAFLTARETARAATTRASIDVWEIDR